MYIQTETGRQAILCPYFAHGCAYTVRKRIGGGKYSYLFGTDQCGCIHNQHTHVLVSKFRYSLHALKVSCMDQSTGQEITNSAKAIFEMRAYFVFLAIFRMNLTAPSIENAWK
jgi:hypothetical protein